MGCVMTTSNVEEYLEAIYTPSQLSLRKPGVFPGLKQSQPDFIQRTMEEDVRYFCAKRGSEIVAASSCEFDFRSQIVEMTDFATLPQFRKKGLAHHLLHAMEEEAKKEQIPITYTIARAGSYPINALLLRAGYEFCGTLVNNTNIFLHIIEAVRELRVPSKILSVGSSEEYGIVQEDDIPLEESTTLRPISPYAVARVAQEQMSRVYADGYHIPIILTRSFNHIGPADHIVVQHMDARFDRLFNSDSRVAVPGDIGYVHQDYALLVHN
jgi:predicted GNAT family acetyltransferase